jgi:hypothetical protein
MNICFIHLRKFIHLQIIIHSLSDYLLLNHSLFVKFKPEVITFMKFYQQISIRSISAYHLPSNYAFIHYQVTIIQ